MCILIICYFFPFPLISAKGTAIGQDLLAHSHDLWGLLPAFSHYPIDLSESFGPLADALIKFLKEDSFMHENVAVALQVSKIHDYFVSYWVNLFCQVSVLSLFTHFSYNFI